MSRRQRRIIGALLSVPLDKRCNAYAWTLPEVDFAFFDLRTTKAMRVEEIVTHPIAFRVGVHRSAWCTGRWEVSISDYFRRWQDQPWNIHIDDMRRGVHDHQMFGEGEFDFVPLLGARDKNGHAGVHVELSRHSHDAVNVARKALAFLRGITPDSCRWPRREPSR